MKALIVFFGYPIASYFMYGQYVHEGHIGAVVGLLAYEAIRVKIKNNKYKKGDK